MEDLYRLYVNPHIRKDVDVGDDENQNASHKKIHHRKKPERRRNSSVEIEQSDSSFSSYLSSRIYKMCPFIF